MKVRFIHIILIMLLVPATLFAQERSAFERSALLEDIAETAAENGDENTDLSAVLEELEDLMNHPLSINNVSRTELEKLRFLSPAQIDNLLNYRNKVGQLFSTTELSLIDGFNDDLANKLTLFVQIEAPEEKEFNFNKNEVNAYTHYVIEKAKGFIPDENGDKRFAGSMPKMLLKYKGEKSKHWNWGLTAENDMGEAFFSGNNKAGFDFYSGFVTWQGNKLLRRIIVGDYQVKSGQGLVMWSGYGGRKTIDGMSLRYTGQGLRPYSSAAEYGFMRGIAASFESGQLSFTTFYSNRNNDANVTIVDANDDPAAVSTITESGYHRTGSEIVDKGALNIQTAGLNARYTKGTFLAGLNSGYQRYGTSVQPDPKLYNQYYFRGNENFCISADAQKALKNASLYGEFAVSKSGGTALVAGFDASPASEVALSVVFRDYKKDYHTISGNSFSEFGNVSNERGLYSSITLYSIPRVTLNAYLDTYKSYWVKFSSLRPVSGYDFAVQGLWAISRKLNLQLRYRTETRNENASIESTVKTDTYKTTNKIRLNTEWKATNTLTFRLRSEWNSVEKDDSLLQGFMVLADANAKLFNEKLSATARVAWFDTDHYNSGIRTYENDLPLNFSVPVYYLKGMRYYINLNYKASRALTIYFKLSQTLLNNEYTSIGSGDLAIEGKQKTEIKFQVRYKF